MISWLMKVVRTWRETGKARRDELEFHRGYEWACQEIEYSSEAEIEASLHDRDGPFHKGARQALCDISWMNELRARRAAGYPRPGNLEALDIEARSSATDTTA